MPYFAGDRNGGSMAYGRRMLEEGSGRLPRLCLTGGPASGKSKILSMLVEEFGEQIVPVPEVIDELRKLGYHFPGGELGEMFDASLAELQTGFEHQAEIEGRRRGAKLVVCDRGVLDKAAYMRDGVTALERALCTSRQYELSRYDRLVILEVPPPAIYEEVRTRNDNPTRRETTWAAAMERHLATVQAWSGHPSCVIIGVQDEFVWKYQQVREHALDVISATS